MSRYIPRTNRQHVGISQEVPNYISVYFHRDNINKLKRALGSRCTYIGHGRIEKNELKPKVNARGEEDTSMFERKKVQSVHYIIAKFGKGIKPITAALNGTPNDIKAEYYTQLKNDLTNAARERGIL